MKKISILLLSVFFVQGLLAQTISVTGVVSDASGQPVTGAVAVVKGSTTNAAVTDLDGNYRLDNVPASASIEVSCLGYEAVVKRAAVSLDFVLKESTEFLQEAVVTGMTRTDKRLFTGATDQLSAVDVNISGIGDVSRSLEGKSAGVSVQNVSGTFGAAPKIRVRGATSIFGDSKPLWVVDGVIMEDVVEVDATSLSSGDATTLISSAIAGLNADDIESFQILKDGSATSIYGARAMAGVIVVTTKKGSPGKAQVRYSGEYTMRLIPTYSEFNIMNSQEQMTVYKEMFNKGWLNYSDVVFASSSGVYGKMSQLINTYNPETGRFMVENTPEGRNAYLRNAEYRNTDWFKVLFRNSVQHNHSVSLSAGTEKGSYYASLGALVDPGWTLQSKVNRYTAMFNASQKILQDYVTLNIIGNASYRQQRAPGSLSSRVNASQGTVSRDFDINPFSYALNTSRTLDPDEYYTRNYAPFNIVNELEKNYMDLDVVDTKFQGEIKVRPVKALDISALGSVRYQISSTEHNIREGSNQAEAYRANGSMMITGSNPYLYDNPDLPGVDPYPILEQGGILIRNAYNALSLDGRISANYNDVFADKHIVTAYAAMEINALNRHSTSFTGWGLQYDAGEIPFYSLDLFKSQLEDNTYYYSMSNSRERNVAFAATASYSYDYRYTINGTFRYEGSNRLGRSRTARWLPTWNVSGKWSVDQEDFFRHLRPALSSLSFRASYSLTADRGPAWVNNSTVLIYSTNPWRGSTDIMESAFYISAVENSELTYEKKHEFNAGFDAGFLNDRIILSMDAYTRNNFDLIGQMVTSGMGGVVNKYGNVASMKSSGVELSLATKNFDRKDFKWTTNFIFSKMKNEVTDLKTTLRTIDYLTGSGYSMQGYPRGAMFSLQFMGLNDEGIPTFLNENGELTSTSINFQGTGDSTFLKYEGTIDPTITGSFGNVFRYKNFSLNVFMTYSFGNVVRLNPVFSSRYSDLTATPREFADRYINPGDELKTSVPVIASARQNRDINNLFVAYSAYNYSTARVAKGDFIRLKEISLSYDLPKKAVEAIRLSSLSFKLQATNLALLYADKRLNGQDPEFFNSGGVAVPMPKQFTLTCRIGF
ncbi:MAG: SusC/RagA family TonB-linked outer membrane protein [Bacteroidales bacterium]|nr:SusC/RagA family TonB-linked outer membrane protein [Bacteroidales bacterium]